MTNVHAQRSLGGRVALITGAGSGIGRAAAELFAEHGARVVASDIDTKGGHATVERIQRAGGEAAFVRADVSVSSDVESLVAATLERFGQLDCAYNNAGIASVAHPIADMPDELFDRAVAVMLRGVFLCMKHEIPAMLAQGGDRYSEKS